MASTVAAGNMPPRIHAAMTTVRTSGASGSYFAREHFERLLVHTGNGFGLEDS
jgi:hypothetical protein